jgi:hypothetical protein
VISDCHPVRGELKKENVSIIGIWVPMLEAPSLGCQSDITLEGMLVEEIDGDGGRWRLTT